MLVRGDDAAGPRAWWLVLVGLLLLWPGHAVGGPPAAAPVEGPSQADETLVVERLNQRAGAIEALLEGRLDPQVSLADLFVLELDDPAFAGPEGWSGLLGAIAEARIQVAAEPEPEPARAPGKRRASEAPPEAPPDPVDLALPLAPADADALARARNRVARAYLRFALLEPDERQARLDTHEARRAQLDAHQQSQTLARARLERLRREATQLAALIEGRLDPEVDPRPLLWIDLGATDELLGDPERLVRALGQPTPSSEADPTSEPEFDKAIREAEQALDFQRLRYLALTPEQRQGLLAQHRESQLPAEPESEVDLLMGVEEEAAAEVEDQINEAEEQAVEANRAREEALEAAGKARSEAIRRLATERARLLGVKEQHALYRAELRRRNKQVLATHETALEWDRRVGELVERSANHEVASEADTMFEELRAVLGVAREYLRATLDQISGRGSGVEPVGEALAGLPEDIGGSDLRALQAELDVSEAELHELEFEVLWRAADSERDDIVMLNEGRLVLLELGSEALRQRVTGLGADGIAQVRREIDQIVLELHYRTLSLPRHGRQVLRDIEASPLPFVFAILELAALILGFRMWRKRADGLLTGFRRKLLTTSGPPPPRRARVLATLVWYLARIRKPLEWLGLFALLFAFVIPNGELLEFEVLWLILLWLLVGSTVILLVDAIAAHEAMIYGRGTRESAALRIRSLRVVGLTIVLTGLVLSLTEEVVGRGAIHRWVRTLIWLAAIPISLWLIHRWRKLAFARIQSDPDIPDNLLVRWIRAHQHGWASFIAAAVASMYLVGRGVLHWLLRRATALETTRRVLAWMFRREVARHANARDDDAAFHAIDAELYDHFDPNALAEQPNEEIARAELDHLIELDVARPGTLCAVIGERGSGKTTFLRRAAAALEGHAVLVVQCPPGGFPALLGALAVALELPRDATRESIVGALTEQVPRVILIDDMNRLVRPAIGGLRALEHFAELAREADGHVSWVCAIGAAAWQYVTRASGERVLFDRVEILPAWTERQLGALIRRRSASANIQPNFDAIVIPRQFDAATLGETEQRPSESERAELGYYRILWDYAEGNPAIALHFWRESLAIAEGAPDSSRPTVRLFKELPTGELDAIGPTIHFVLRAVIQLEDASPEDLIACTQLSGPEVADALRFALGRGWIEREPSVGEASVGERYHITWPWYRAVTNVLGRQHLLVL